MQKPPKPACLWADPPQFLPVPAGTPNLGVRCPEDLWRKPPKRVTQTGCVTGFPLQNHFNKTSNQIHLQQLQNTHKQETRKNTSRPRHLGYLQLYPGRHSRQGKHRLGVCSSVTQGSLGPSAGSWEWVGRSPPTWPSLQTRCPPHPTPPRRGRGESRNSWRAVRSPGPGILDTLKTLPIQVTLAFLADMKGELSAPKEM